jgi:MFS family permease
MGLDQWPNKQALIGTATGVYYAGGGVFGCLLNSWVADRYGRKWTVIVANVILLVSSACLAGSVSIAMFIAFRFFTGFRYTPSQSDLPIKASDSDQ